MRRLPPLNRPLTLASDADTPLISAMFFIGFLGLLLIEELLGRPPDAEHRGPTTTTPSLVGA